MSDVTDIILRTLTNSPMQTKGSELTYSELDGNIIALSNMIQAIVSAGGNITVYNIADAYDADVFVSFDNGTDQAIYKSNSPIAAGQSPTVSPTLWDLQQLPTGINTTDDLTEGVINLYFTAARQSTVESYADAKVEDVIVNGVTDKAPAQNVVFDSLALKENTANKGSVNGYASLDGSGLVPSAQLPSYVDDVLEFANLGAFPGTGVTGKIYVALDTNLTYRWSGSVYIEVSSAGAASNITNDSTVVGVTVKDALDTLNTGKEDKANKNAASGYVGLSATFKVALKNAANTFISLLGNTNTAARNYTLQDRDGTLADDTDLALKENVANKNASGGYVGISGTNFRVAMKNIANTFFSFFQNANTASRVYDLPDKSGTVALTDDITINNNNAVVSPTITDDSSLGYTAGVNASRWFNSSLGVWFVCMDATVGAAVWNEDFQDGSDRSIRGLGDGSVGNVGLRTPNKSVFQGDDLGENNNAYTEMSDKEMVFDIQSGQAIKRRRVNDADDTLVKGDFYVNILGITATRTITLPPISNVRDHTVFIIKGSSSVALSAYLIILPDGSETIDDGSHYYYYDANETLTVVANGSTGNWEIIESYSAIEKTGLTSIIAEKSITGNALATTALDWQANKSYASHIPLFYKIVYTSGTLGICACKVKNSVMDLTGTLSLSNVTATQEMSTDNNQAVIHPNSGNISVQVTTASAGASTFSVVAYGIRR